VSRPAADDIADDDQAIAKPAETHNSRLAIVATPIFLLEDRSAEHLGGIREVETALSQGLSPLGRIERDPHRRSY